MASNALSFTSHTQPLMVVDHYIEQLREVRRERKARLNAIRTPRQAMAYQERVREAIARAFSPRPPKTPLNARVTGANEIDVCRIENILFESRPGCYVTANLYIPHGASEKKRCPAVLADCGHSEIGKQADVYQAFPQRLAAAGFITLLIEPFNQGERDQYLHLPESQRKGLSGHCCAAHNMMGKQLELTGEYFGMWRAWDGIRGLDYLLTRPEVDSRHVGVTGNSGGGTMTTWDWAIEPRLTMAAPSCFVTSFLSNLENELPADCEQYPPGVIGAGLEMADFMIARAPRPAILLGQVYDFFDRRGLREAHEEIKRFYRMLKAPARNHELFIGPVGHGYSPHNQDAMVKFFCRHAGLPLRRLAAEKIVDLKEKLVVTPKGNVVAAGSTPIFEQIATIARKQDAERRSAGMLSAPALAKSVRSLLKIEAFAGTPAGARKAPHYRVLRPNSFANYRAARYAIETEGTIRAYIQKPMPTGGLTLDVEEEVTLYLPHISSELELNDRKLAGGLIGTCALYALDVRGLGESLAGPQSGFFDAYGYDYMCHGHGLLFCKSYFGRRVFDVLRTIDLLASCGAKKIDVIGRGQGALLAAFAGVLAPQIVDRVTLRNAPQSFLEWATAPVVSWPAANFPRGVLKAFDIPDLIRVLGRRVRVIEPWDAKMQPVRSLRFGARRKLLVRKSKFRFRKIAEGA
jgi:cephalosporin-C deacetylase-like acetyl esterase